MFARAMLVALGSDPSRRSYAIWSALGKADFAVLSANAYMVRTRVVCLAATKHTTAFWVLRDEGGPYYLWRSCIG